MIPARRGRAASERLLGSEQPPPALAEVTALTLLLLLATALRARHLATPTLTGDEWFMLRNHLEGPVWILNQARVFEPHPLLYYLGFWAWVGLTGTTEWAMRCPSVLFGVLTCAATWRLVRDAVHPPAALGAALLVAVNPYQVAQSQNARNYAMVAALATLATAALLAAPRSHRASGWSRWAALLLLALHTHLNAVLIAVAHGSWLFWRALRSGKMPESATLRASAIVLLLFLPWLVYAYPALTAYQGFYPEKVGFVDVLTRTLGTFAYGQHESPRRAVVALAAALFLLAVTWAIVRAARPRDDGPLLIALTASVPVLAAASLFLVRPMFEERYLIVAAPACVALVALGAVVIVRPLQQRLRATALVAALSGLIVLTIPFLQRYYPATANARPDWRGLAAWVDRHDRPGDVALVTGHGVADAYGYYRRAEAPILLAATPETAAADLDAVLARGPRGVFLLPYWESSPDVAARDRLLARGFADQVRWFRGQRVQYFGLPQSSDPPPTSVGAVWLDAIELVAATVAPTRVAPGDGIRVLLHWRARRPPPDLKLSLRLLRPMPGGEQVAQLDRRPLDDARPFPTLRAGEDLRDGHLLWSPDNPGRFDVALLLYRPDDARAVPPDGRPEDLVRLGTVDVGQ